MLRLLLAVPLLKLGRTLDEATLAIRKTHEGAVPLLADAHDTLRGVNAQLDQVDGITKGVTSMTTNAAALTSIVSSTVSSPLIKVAAFSYGVRRRRGQPRGNGLAAEGQGASARRRPAGRRQDR